jgi:hypothetical protein
LNGFSAFPFESFNDLGVVPFPINPALAKPPDFPPVTLPLDSGAYAVNPDLKLPYTLQWSFAIDQSLGKHQVVSLSYVASAGRRLLTIQRLNRRVGNTGPFPNPNFHGDINYVTNGPTSDYQSLQVQFQRRLSRGLQALLNYTWAHAIDVASDEVATGEFDRGNAAFDVRHNFSAGITYNLPNLKSNRLLSAVLRNWSMDSTIYAQSGQPLNIAVGSLSFGNGTQVSVRPDLVLGQPIWIIDPTLPGGKRINPAAFSEPPRLPGSDCGDCFSRQGTLGRNVVIEPAKYQVNLGLRREFRFSERWNLQLKGEAFNLFNHPLFGSFNTFVGSSDFGTATATLNNALGGLNSLYQLGGPRSLQFSVRLGF